MFIVTIMSAIQLGNQGVEYTFIFYVNKKVHREVTLSSSNPGRYKREVDDIIDFIFDNVKSAQHVDLFFELRHDRNSKYSRVINTYVGSEKDLAKCRQQNHAIAQHFFELVSDGNTLDVAVGTEPGCLVYIIAFLEKDEKLCVNYEYTALATYFSRFIPTLHICNRMADVYRQKNLTEDKRNVTFIYKPNKQAQNNSQIIWTVPTKYDALLSEMSSVCNTIVDGTLQTFTVPLPKMQMREDGTENWIPIILNGKDTMTYNDIPEFILLVTSHTIKHANIVVDINIGVTAGDVKTSGVLIGLDSDHNVLADFVQFMFNTLTTYFISHVTENPTLILDYMNNVYLNQYIPVQTGH